MKNVQFYVDVDDTLLRWTDGFYDYLSKHHRELSISRYSKWFGLEQHHLDPLIREFNQSVEIADLEPTGGNSRVLENAHVLSCCGTHERTVFNRAHNIVFHYGNIMKSVTCLDYHSPKSLHIREVKRHDEVPVLIDDSVFQVRSFVEEFKEEIRQGKALAVLFDNERYPFNGDQDEEKKLLAKDYENLYAYHSPRRYYATPDLKNQVSELLTRNRVNFEQGR